MPNDYGVYGNGIDGYVHYTQAVNEANKRGGGGGKPPAGSGCLTSVIQAFTVIAVAAMVVAAIL